jgi:hypothetical protein
MAAPLAYSLVDVSAAIEGPGGNFSLSDAALANEGITVAMAEDKVSYTAGAGGGGMHNVHAAKHGRVTVRYLQNSPKNRQMMELYNAQNENGGAGGAGQNMIDITNNVSGDVIQCQYGSIMKIPDITYAQDGGVREWAILFTIIDIRLGDGNIAI